MDKSGSAQSVGKNYKTEVAAGKPKKQALAIALSEERTHAKGKRKAKLEDAYAKYIETKWPEKSKFVPQQKSMISL